MRSARIAWLIATIALIAPSTAAGADYGFTQAPGSPFDTNSDPGDVIVADLDGDTYPDAILGDAFGSTITIFWGQAGGGFSNAAKDELNTAGAASHLVVARLDGDADLDIAGAGSSFQPWFKDNGARTFTDGGDQSVDTGDGFDGAQGLVAADFDQDGDNDLAISVFIASSGGVNGGAVRLVRNGPTSPGSPGTFTFEPDIVDEEDYVGDIVTGFFNNDLDPDLAYMYFVDSGFFGDPFIGVQLGAANRSFGARANIALESTGDLGAQDLDGDTELDLLTDGSTLVHWGNGDGTFDPATEASPEGGIGFFFGDFNNDGLKDIGLDGDPVQLLTNKGARTFALGGEFASSDFGYHGAAADLDGDPRDDLVLGGFFEMIVLKTGDPPPDPPPGNGGGGGDTTPPPSDPGPGPAPDPAPLPPAPPLVTPVVPVSASQIATLPSNRRCVSRRKFKIRLRRPPPGVTVTEARVLVNGKRVKVVRGTRLTAPVDLRGLPKGKVTVTIRITLSDGRVLRGTRKYRTCATKKRGSRRFPKSRG